MSLIDYHRFTYPWILKIIECMLVISFGPGSNHSVIDICKFLNRVIICQKIQFIC